MLEELSLLIKLQHIDLELMELEAETGDLPEQVQRLKAEIEQFDTDIGKAREELEKVETEKQNQNRELRGSHEALKRSQSLIYSVKTSREYDAISAEIEQAKSHITEGERQVLELKAHEEEINNYLENRLSQLETIEREWDERNSEMGERLGTIDGRDDELKHEREKILVRLKRPVLAHYERIRKLRDGFGVSHIQNNACSYCFSMIPPQRQAEIRKMEDMLLCEVCGCVIVSDEFSEEIQL